VRWAFAIIRGEGRDELHLNTGDIREPFSQHRSQHQRLIHGENMANAYLQGVEISASQFLDIFHHYDNDGNFFPYFVDFMN